MSWLTLGIDVSKAKLDVALYQVEQYEVASFHNDQDGHRALAKWLKKRGARSVQVCLEATGRYGEEVAAFLHQRGYVVSIVNPARVKGYATAQLKRNKTDLEDAKVIAHFCATQRPLPWTPPPPEVRELQALTRHLEQLKADHTRELNRQQAGTASTAVAESIEQHLAFLKGQIAALEQQIRQLIDQHPRLRQQRELLCSIPGIGETTAAKFIAEVPDVLRFDSAAQLAAYGGLTPRQHSSGTSVYRRSRLSKTGNARFRTAWYMPALAAMRHNPLIQALVERLERRGKSRMTIVAAVMRKLLHIAYGVLKHGQPFDPLYLVNVQATA